MATVFLLCVKEQVQREGNWIFPWMVNCRNILSKEQPWHDFLPSGFCIFAVVQKTVVL